MKLRYYLLFFFLFTFIATISITFLFIYYDNHKNQISTTTNIIIPKGASLDDISTILYQKNLIAFPHLFGLMRRLDNSATKLHYGEYNIMPYSTPANITEQLINRDIVNHFFIVVEGKTSNEIVTLLNNNPFLSGEKITKIPNEGAILPETYHFHHGDNRHQLLHHMITAMKKFSHDIWQQRHDNIEIKTIDELVILASLIEKETAKNDERHIVSAVFHNRLRKNMRLQTDPAVIYAITQGKYILNRPLTKKDLKIKSPYNLYRHHGLPPTAIANPGKASLLAAIQPATSDFLYFVADGDGGHFFANDYETHKKNIKKYRQRK